MGIEVILTVLPTSGPPFQAVSVVDWSIPRTALRCDMRRISEKFGRKPGGAPPVLSTVTCESWKREM